MELNDHSHGRWFSLRPVSKTELSSTEFKEWTNSRKHRQHLWLGNAPGIQAKR